MVEIQLTELCQELRNYFDRGRYSGRFEIRDGEIYAGENTLPIREGMYFCVWESWLNDGIHKFPDTDMVNETFDGSVWLLAIPAPVQKLAEEITEWRKKYEAPGSSAMSPFMSESFGGYSYQKGSALTGKDTSGSTGWKRTFAGRMNAWRKM